MTTTDMTDTVHPNVSLLERVSQFIPNDIASAKDFIAEDFVWHFFNFRLPDLDGDYVGLNGLQSFFEKLAAVTNGTFQVNPISVIPMGDELVITHVKDQMTWEGQPLELDAVVVWRIVGGCIAEAWDIPSLYIEFPLAEGAL